MSSVDSLQTPNPSVPSESSGTGLRVLMVTDHFYPDLSSGGRLLTDLAEGLASSTQMSVITAFSEYNSTRSNLASETYKGTSIRRVWSSSFSRQRIWGRLLNELSFCFASSWVAMTNPRPDVIYVLSSPPFLPLFIAVVSHLRRVPYLFVMMDVFPDIAVSMGLVEPRSLLVRFWEFLSRAALRRASRIVVLGRCMQAVIEKKLGNKHVPIDVIHNWSDRRAIYPIAKAENPFFDTYPDLRDKFVVLYSGNLGRFQDFETILAAAEKLKSDDTIRVVIAGDGVRKPWLTQEIAQRHLSNTVLLPFVSQAQLIYSLNATDLGLVTLERGAEGLGVPSKFYPLIAAGRPILALMGQSAEVARLVEEHDIGAVVAQGDVEGVVRVIQRYARDHQAHQLASQRALQLFLERFDRDVAIREYAVALHRTAATKV